MSSGRASATEAVFGDLLRANVEAAFDWMTQPLVGAAVWTDGAKHAIVETSPQL